MNMKRISEWFRRTLRQLDEAAHYWDQDPWVQLERRIRQLEEGRNAIAARQHHSGGPKS